MHKKILVIDDDAAVRKSFLLALEDRDYHVDTAETGEQGIQMARQQAYQLIFLDLKMPGINGVQTLRRIRQENTDTPIYIITAFHSEFFNELKEAQNDQLDFEVMRKPLDSEQILTVTRGVLDGMIVQ